MFRQILIHPDHRNLQLILWKNSVNDPVQTFKLNTVTYGTSCAPYLATRTIKQLAIDEGDSFPLAAAVIIRDTYMDDILSGSSDFQEFQLLQEQLVDLFKKAEDQAYDFSCEPPNTVKSRGVTWNPNLDYLTFKVGVNIHDSYTKRPKVLSTISRLFDPLGFLGPILTKAKLFLQKLWILRLEWDESLPDSMAKDWQCFVSTLPAFEDMQIPRHVGEKSGIVIHGFSDASAVAYGAVLYMQSISEETSYTRLLCSRSRVSPVKPITIPRLELCASVLLAQHLNKVLKSLTLPIQQIMLWTDSTIVLAWLQQSPDQLKTFIYSYSTVEIQEEIESISKGRAFSGKSKLNSLKPFLDGHQIVRVGGRLHNAALDYSQKHPADHPFTELLMTHLHIKNLHLGPQTLLYCTRERFWPLRGRSIARKIVHKCIVCFKHKPLVTNQLMGTLPRERVNPNYPFLHSGVDYCGPFQIKYKRQRKGNFQRIYVTIFVCLASKAIHLEVVSDLTTDAFLATLKRFVARRGKCATISQDNAKNFVGASRELPRLQNLTRFPDEKLASYLASEGIVWNFIPPRAPNFGGLWEAGVKSFKFYLKGATGNLKLTFEEFLTITTQVEGILNSRPLTPLSDDIDDLDVLTPGHFLVGRSITAIAEPSLLDKLETRLSRWQRLTKIVQYIWSKWSRDYLNNLQQRTKWKVEKTNINLNAMVLIKEDNIPVNQWSLGRILKLFLGTDGKVRERGDATREYEIYHILLRNRQRTWVRIHFIDNHFIDKPFHRHHFIDRSFPRLGHFDDKPFPRQGQFVDRPFGQQGHFIDKSFRRQGHFVNNM
ncbi:uncharacterized protein [Parasteatoda tepidariorum]|uniref:uncharacterized protein n=1 Tax=Parasteatoda tepidariorum TaxID=114398 RepID=UPI0039BC6284